MRICHLALTVVVCSALGGCWKSYDSKKPDDYYKYWGDDTNRKSSILYPYTESYKDDQRERK